MPDSLSPSSMSMASLIGNIIFSSIGMVALGAGKRGSNVDMMMYGGALMLFPYFVSNTALMFVIGAALTAGAWRCRT